MSVPIFLFESDFGYDEVDDKRIIRSNDGVNCKFITQSEYMQLSESIKPRKISYGTNSSMNDGKVSNEYGNRHTFINRGKYSLFVGITDDGIIAFGSSTPPSINLYDYTDKRSGQNESFKAFGFVFYVILEIIKLSKHKELRFDSADPGLGRVYDLMVRNKTLLEELKKSRL